MSQSTLSDMYIAIKHSQKTCEHTRVMYARKSYCVLIILRVCPTFGTRIFKGRVAQMGLFKAVFMPHSDIKEWTQFTLHHSEWLHARL